MHTTHNTTILEDRLVPLYAIVKGLTIDVSKIIEKEIRDCAIRKQKSAALVFPSLITCICEASWVKFEAGDERVKNVGAITTRTMKRIVGDTTAAVTPQHPTAATLQRLAPTKTEQAPGLEDMV